MKSITANFRPIRSWKGQLYADFGNRVMGLLTPQVMRDAAAELVAIADRFDAGEFDDAEEVCVVSFDLETGMPA